MKRNKSSRRKMLGGRRDKPRKELNEKKKLDWQSLCSQTPRYLLLHQP
jgi:hypothetical protein